MQDSVKHYLVELDRACRMLLRCCPAGSPTSRTGSPRSLLQALGADLHGDVAEVRGTIALGATALIDVLRTSGE